MNENARKLEIINKHNSNGTHDVPLYFLTEIPGTDTWLALVHVVLNGISKDKQ